MKTTINVAGWLALGMLGCGSAAAAPRFDHALGLWGGPHIGIQFQGGLAEVQLDCASGTIDDPVYPAADGSFAVKGTYRIGASGPIRVGQIFRSEEASYSGRISGGATKRSPHVMTLAIVLEDGTSLGPFTLTEGTPAQLQRCA